MQRTVEGGYQKVGRQLKILGIILNKYSKDIITVNDLAEKLNVHTITIERDLQALRKLGISIGSVKNCGIKISGKVEENIFRNLFIKYVSHYYSEEICNIIFPHTFDINESIKLFKTSEIFLKFNKAIDSSNKITILLKTNERYSNVNPQIIFLENSQWILLIESEGNHYFINIDEVENINIIFESSTKLSKEKIIEITEERKLQSRNNKRYKIKIMFSAFYDGKGIPKYLTNLKLISETGQNRIFELETTSLERAANWIIENNLNVLVLEPQQLKNKLIDSAKKIILKYAHSLIYLDKDHGIRYMKASFDDLSKYTVCEPKSAKMMSVEFEFDNNDYEGSNEEMTRYKSYTQEEEVIVLENKKKNWLAKIFCK